MKNFTINYGWMLWLGFSLAQIEVSPLSWELYFVAIPTIVLVEVYKLDSIWRKNERNS